LDSIKPLFLRELRRATIKIVITNKRGFTIFRDWLFQQPSSPRALLWESRRPIARTASQRPGEKLLQCIHISVFFE